MPDATIAELPSAGSVAGTDLVPVFRDGQTFAATVSEIQVANTTPTYVVMGSDGSLPNERVLTAGTGITVVDNGSGSTAVIEIGTNPVVPGSGRIKLPSGTTAQRAAGTFGDFRANSDLDALEWFDGNGAWTTLASGVVYVSSVGLSLPAELTVSGSPITTSGTLSATWASAAQNAVFAGPSGGSGTPSFRALVASDIPSLSYLSATLASTNIFVGSGAGVATGVALSGDATIANTGALTLATVNSNVGSFGSASSVATFTADGKGRLTAAASTPIALAWSALTSGVPTTVAGYGITDTASVAGGFAVTLTATGITNVTLPTSGTLLTSNQSITLSGDISGTGATAITTAIGANKVTTGMLAQAAGSTILGNSSTSTANVAALTDAQAATVLARYLELAPRWYS